MNSEDITMSAVVVAAGNSARMGFDKQLYNFNGQPVIYHTVAALAACEEVMEIVVVGGGNLPLLKKALQNIQKVAAFVKGGATRTESVQAGVALARGRFVAVHDGARPFVSQAVVARTFAMAQKTGAAAPAVQVKDTIKLLPGGIGTAVAATPNREELFAVQTPQIFEKQLLNAAFAAATKSYVDDCAALEAYGVPVYLVEGDYANYKITTPEDLPAGECGSIKAKKANEFLKHTQSAEVHKAVKENIEMMSEMRIGHGYDVHRLACGYKLILAGVQVQYEKGLVGHSDADVLAHAVSDAMLGALALGDIGAHFPDTDQAYKGANSMQLLQKVCKLVQNKGYKVVNIDATLLCQEPKLAPYIPAMRANLAAAVATGEEDISVKATTEEGLGFTGEGHGIAAHAVVLLCKAAQ